MPPVIVIPCYNEARRLDAAELARLVADGRVEVIAVDDGSSDGTGVLLAAIARDLDGRMQVLTLPRNQGKAEAVRAGLRLAIARGADIVGFADADFATPPGEILRLVDVLASGDAEIVLGSRVRRLGADIDRSALRHVVGRVFATAARMAVGTPVYDTQCGAKVFRVTPALEAALAEPFSSRWSFDVELLARLFGRLPSAVATHPSRAVEVPLEVWHDAGGSKLGVVGMARSFAELIAIWARAERHTRRS
ncbi:MAG: glycosyltransferase [Deltaproteobacteria bacterium]|nr:glycosyltransferase [Deltaproteobacteria bacterium]